MDRHCPPRAAGSDADLSRQLEAVLAEYVAHFNAHRSHRTLNQAAPLQPLPPPALPSQLRVRRRDRLGGLIREYFQVALRGWQNPQIIFSRITLWYAVKS